MCGRLDDGVRSGQRDAARAVVAARRELLHPARPARAESVSAPISCRTRSGWCGRGAGGGGGREKAPNVSILAP